MILSTRQSTRFIKLFDPLIEYLIGEYHKAGTGTKDFESIEDEIDFVCDYVWGEDDHLDLIDRYLETTKDRINATDRRAILDFKDGIYGVFPAARVGADTLFLHGSYSYAVRGIGDEIDDTIGGLPCITRTLLVPFDGLITYGTVICVIEDDSHDDMLYLIEDLLHQAPDGTIARTARDFRRIAPLAKEEMSLAEQTYGSDEDDLVLDDHVGALAGLSWDERAKAIEDHVRTYKSNEERTRDIADIVDPACEKGRPPRSVKAYFERFNKRELIDLAKGYGFKGNQAKKSKAQLVQMVTASCLEHADDAITGAITWGYEDTKYLNDLVEAGGTIRISKESLLTVHGIPTPCPPLVSIYHDGEDYLVTMPPDVLEKIKDADFEAAIEKAKMMDRLVSRVNTLITFHGVVLVDEVVQFLSGGQEADSIDAYEVLAAIAVRSLNGALAIDIANLPEAGGRLLLHIQLARTARIEDDGRVRNAWKILDIVDGREGKPARPINDDLSLDSLVRGKESYRKLCAFLDRHVPAGEDDYDFAESVANYIVFHTRNLDIVSDLFADALGFCPALTDEDSKEYTHLVMDLINDSPQWVNYGWSANELDLVWQHPQKHSHRIDSSQMLLPGGRQ